LRDSLAAEKGDAMGSLRTTSKILGTFAALVLSGSMLSAQATRTWVSGVGDDANPCSRTAPCKTFAGAISKTAAKGEINVLDPGGFGGVTITKSISIINDGVGSAGVLVSGTNAIIINAAAPDVIVLRGLDIEGLGTGLAGVKLIAGGSLTIENCTINNFAAHGVDYEPNGPSQLAIKHSTIRNNVAGGATKGGILIKPAAGGFALASIDGVQLERNGFGLQVGDNSKVVIRDSSINGSSSDGINVTTTSIPSTVNVVSTTISNNTTGITTSGTNSVVNVNGVTIAGNTTGLSHPTGQIISHSSNVVIDPGTFSSVVPQQ
jgi:hypothetical protein